MLRALLFTALFFCTSAQAQNTLFPANPGDMIVKGGASAWVPVPGGTAGCVLTSNGPAAAPIWQCALALNFRLPPMAPNTVWGNVTSAQAVGTQITASQFLNTLDYDIQRPPLPGAIIYKGLRDELWHTAPPAARGWVWTSYGPGEIPQWAPPGTPPGVFLPETYGAVCDNSTDNTEAFIRLTAAVNTAGGGRVELSETECTYSVYPAPAPGLHFMMLFRSVNGLTINFNKATIASAYDFSGAAGLYPLYFYQSSNIIVNNPKFDQPNYRTRNFDRGIRAVWIEETSNVIINNLSMNGGSSGVTCGRASSRPKGNGIVINNAHLVNVFYGIVGQKGCDNLRGNIATTNAGRSYFVYNVSNHRVQVTSDASDGYNDIVISHDADSADTTNGAYLTDDITVDYFNSVGPTAGAGVSSFSAISFVNPGTQVYQQISNIHLNMNVQRTDSAVGPLLEVINQASTPQGRLLENIYVTGGLSSNGTSHFINLMTDKDWTGDYVRNIHLKNLTCRYGGAAPLTIDGRAIIGPVTLDNIISNGTCTFTPTNMAGAFKYLSYNQVWLPDLITPGAVTVANLPTCNANNVGTRYQVSNANATTFHSVVAGGGANIVEVVCLNSTWLIGG